MFNSAAITPTLLKLCSKSILNMTAPVQTLVLKTQILLTVQNLFPNIGNKITYSTITVNLWSHPRHRTYRVTPAPSSWVELLYVNNRL